MTETAGRPETDSPRSKSVLLIARDGALRKSLAFALEVEGYVVDAQDSLIGARQNTGPSAWAVVDDAVYREHRDTSEFALPMIFLGSPTGLHLPKGAVVLTKPLRMPELLSALRKNP